MITLEQFFPLMNRNTDVALYENGRQIFHGLSICVPDDYWRCRVTDFRIVTDDSIVFQVKRKKPKKTEGTNWREGTLRVHDSNYWYEMKQFDEGSEYGINHGRISKLTMKRYGTVVCCYDRGWVLQPTDPDAQLALDILLHTENY